MSAYPPPSLGNSVRFNPTNFYVEEDYLTLLDGDNRYLRLVGGSIVGALGITGNLSVSGTLTAPGLFTQASGDARYLQLSGGSINGSLEAIKPELTASSLCTEYPYLVRHNVSTDGARTGIAFACISSTAGATPGAAIMLRRQGTNGYGNLEFWTKPTTTLNENLTEWLRLTYNGRFGTNTAERFYGSRGRIDSNNYCLFGTGDIGGDSTFTDKLVYQYSPELLTCSIGFTCSTLTTTQVSASRLLIGSTDTSRLISALDSGMATGTSRYISLGRSNDLKNQAEISFYYNGSGDNGNRLDFGFYGGALMYLLANGRLGLGTSSPSCGLDVATGENSVTFTTNIGVNSLSYAISSNSWTNFGGGPYSANICARFRGSVWIQDRLWATSDRRLKDEIKPLDFDLEHFRKLNPVSYKWKNQQSVQLGLIAQDVKNVCAEAVSYTENDNMIGGSEDEPAGVQLTVDYNAINMMNVTAIKKLIEINKDQQKQIDSLRDIVDKLSSRPVVQKWLNKQQPTTDTK